MLIALYDVSIKYVTGSNLFVFFFSALVYFLYFFAVRRALMMILPYHMSICYEC